MRKLLLMLVVEKVIIYFENKYQADYDKLSHDVKQKDRESL